MAQLFAPSLNSSCSTPVVKTVTSMLGPSTAANFGAAAGISLEPSGGLLSDITIILVTTAETTAISAKDWGGSTIPASALEVINVATGNTVVASALASGTYKIQNAKGAGLYQSLIFTKSAAVNAGTAVVSAAYDLQGNL